LLKTDPDTAFFWSGRTNGIGGADRAAEIAKTKGGVTLESTIFDKNIKMPEWDFNNLDSIKAWEDASAEYAKQVSGEIRAVVGKELREGNIWENVELPRLKQNPNVSKITIIDPETGIEKIIFERWLDMNITGTMSYIKVEIEGKTVKIEGEKVIGGFIAFKNTIKNWEPPYENEIIDEKLKQEIIQKVSDKTKNSHLVITFE